MHHYLQVEELEEPEEIKEIREAGELKVAKKTLLKSCIKDIYQQSRKIVDLDKCLLL
jgi:ribosomal protein L10